MYLNVVYPVVHSNDCDNKGSSRQTREIAEHPQNRRRKSHCGGSRPIRVLPQGRQPVPLEITQRDANGIYILALRGRLVLGQESSGLRTTVNNLLSSGVTRLVINLEHVNYVDSAGLGALIEAHRTTKAQGGRVKLSNLGPKFKEALQVVRLIDMFETFPTEAAAVASFGS
jgi:anti-sigma B factor antagonist